MSIDRYYLFFVVLSCAVLAVGGAVAEAVGLSPTWTFAGGMLAATALDPVATWLHELKAARETIEEASA